MRYYSLLICCLLLAAVTTAQTFLPLGHETEWSIVGTGENTMYHSESEAVVPVKEGNSFALIMVDKQTKEKWKTSIGGSILGWVGEGLDTSCGIRGISWVSRRTRAEASARRAFLCSGLPAAVEVGAAEGEAAAGKRAASGW